MDSYGLTASGFDQWLYNQPLHHVVQCFLARNRAVYFCLYSIHMYFAAATVV